MKIFSLLMAICCMAAAVPAAADLLPPPPRYVLAEPFSSDVSVEPGFAMVPRANAQGTPVPCFTVTVPGPCNMSVALSARTEPVKAWRCYVHNEAPLASRFLIPIPADALTDGEKAVFSLDAEVKLHRYQKGTVRKKGPLPIPAGSTAYLFVDEQGPRFQCSHSAVLEKKGGAMLPADVGGQSAHVPGGIPETWLKPWPARTK